MAPDPDDLLAGLDDQQREAVTCDDLPRASSWPAPARARPGPHPAHRLAVAPPAATTPARPRPHLHPGGGRRAPAPARGCSACGGRSGPARSTPSAWAELQWYRGPSAGAPPGRRSTEPRRCCPPGARRSSRGRRVELGDRAGLGPRPARRPRRLPDGGRAGAPGDRRRRPTSSPSSASATPTRSGAAASSTSTTCSRVLADAIERDTAFAAPSAGGSEHLYVDEFQDLNPLQFRFLPAMPRRGSDRPVRRRRPEPGDLRLERRRPATLLERFAERWPGATVVAVDRTLPLDAPGRARSPTALLDAGGLRRLTVTGLARPDGPRPTIAGYDDEATEAAARRPRAASTTTCPGGPWAHQAVLARTNAQLDVARGRRSARPAIPYRGHGGDRSPTIPSVRRALRGSAAARRRLPRRRRVARGRARGGRRPAAERRTESARPRPTGC